MSTNSRRELLRCLFLIGVAAVEPGSLVERALGGTGGRPEAPVAWGQCGRVFVVGGGKAAAAMGEAASRALGPSLAGGILAVPDGRQGRVGRLRLLPAEHPLPGEGSRAAARAILALLQEAGPDDLVISLISGGGSSLLSAPVAGVEPEAEAACVEFLLRAGVDIVELNTVRKHLSLVKGGLLARASHPAHVLNLMLSDVPGDDPSVIASGPFSPDPTTYADALAVLENYDPTRRIGGIPEQVRKHLEAGSAGLLSETPKPGDPVFLRIKSQVIGGNRTAVAAIVDAARATYGLTVVGSPLMLDGEARDAGSAFAKRLRRLAETTRRDRAILVVGGGETTVTVRGSGRGGRNQEFTLGAALVLQNHPGINVLAAGTDGIDGPTDAAGAFADGSTCTRAQALGMDPLTYLRANDSHGLFAGLGDLLITGPTGTNVADLALALID